MKLGVFTFEIRSVCGTLIPGDPEKSERIEDIPHVFRPDPVAVHIIDAQKDRSAIPPG
jgi:hypothetical protein